MEVMTIDLRVSSAVDAHLEIHLVSLHPPVSAIRDPGTLHPDVKLPLPKDLGTRFWSSSRAQLMRSNDISLVIPQMVFGEPDGGRKF